MVKPRPNWFGSIEVKGGECFACRFEQRRQRQQDIVALYGGLLQEASNYLHNIIRQKKLAGPGGPGRPENIEDRINKRPPFLGGQL